MRGKGCQGGSFSIRPIKKKIGTIENLAENHPVRKVEGMSNRWCQNEEGKEQKGTWEGLWRVAKNRGGRKPRGTRAEWNVNGSGNGRRNFGNKDSQPSRREGFQREGR